MAAPGAAAAGADLQALLAVLAQLQADGGAAQGAQLPSAGSGAHPAFGAFQPPPRPAAPPTSSAAQQGRSLESLLQALEFWSQVGPCPAPVALTPTRPDQVQMPHGECSPLPPLCTALPNCTQRPGQRAAAGPGAAAPGPTVGADDARRRPHDGYYRAAAAAGHAVAERAAGAAQRAQRCLGRHRGSGGRGGGAAQPAAGGPAGCAGPGRPACTRRLARGTPARAVPGRCCIRRLPRPAAQAPPGGGQRRRRHLQWQGACRPAALHALLKRNYPTARPTPKPTLPTRALQICSNCHTSNTPFWRKDRHSGLPLCNACG